MKRPEHLPEFEQPPLDEVVIGVQFTPLVGYSSVHASEIWELFKSEFPHVQEHPMLDPKFETFGRGAIQPSFQFQFGPPPLGSRLWFISTDGNHLLQFQSDRLLANWRKAGVEVDYPRFEAIASNFKKNLQALSGFCEENFGGPLVVNQAELTYVNLIPVESFAACSDWLVNCDGSNIEYESMQSASTEVLTSSDGKPIGRLYHQASSAFHQDGEKKAIRFELTFRGKPPTDELPDVVEFLSSGREFIVDRFASMTTEKAHISWKRSK